MRDESIPLTKMIQSATIRDINDIHSND